LQRITRFIELQGAVPGIQLAHAGRKASCHVPWKGGHTLTAAEGAWQTWAPSAIPFHESDPLPREMNKEEIKQVINNFAAAAQRAAKAGFKIIELHAAHGYLLNEFLSPLSNHRNDEYGGSFENRVRIVVEIVEAVRRVWDDSLPLFIRISATDWVEGGWTPHDSVQLASVLINKGVDLIDCSSGGNSPAQQIALGPMYQTGFAEKIKKETGIRTGAVGLITSAAQAEDILQQQRADLIILARQLLRDPYFPLHAAKELGVDLPWPVQYLRAKK